MQQKRGFFNSLSVRFTIIIVLIEMAISIVTGTVYTNNFTQELNQRAQANAVLPIKLINEGLLELGAFAEPGILQDLVQDEITNAFIVGINDNIFFSLNPEFRGTSFSEFAETLAIDGFDLFAIQDTFIGTTTNGDVITASPIVGEDGRTVRFIAFLEISNAALQAEIAALIQIFVLGGMLTIVVTSVVLLLMFNLVIFRRIQETLGVLDVASSGNLRIRIPKTARDEIGALQQGTNDMIARLQALVDGLEQRVADRTRDLTVSADVSRQIATILNVRELFEELVERAADAFDFYQVSIFAYDPVQEKLDLVAASGDVGDKMIADGKSFLLAANGLVPSAARSKQATVSNNVLDPSTSYHVFNPLRPETRSEAAFPVMLAGEVLGVLDLQSTEVDRFGAASLQLFSSFADQIAVAFRNAALFEQAEAQRLRAEQADKAKSAFLASTSHELRTPLNAIINLTSFVKRGMMGATTAKQEEVLGLVIQSGQNLLSLINDVLDMSKIESGSLKLYIEPDIDLKPIFINVSATTESLLQSKPVRLITEIQPDLPMVTVDKHRFQQILLNILSNACKFTEEGEICLSASIEEGHLKVMIRDTGIGIAPKDYDKVFEKFVQTESGLRQGGGTGLGMPITRSLVEAHGGRIWLESTVNVGTKFYFTIPLLNTTQSTLKSKEATL